MSGTSGQNAVMFSCKIYNGAQFQHDLIDLFTIKEDGR